MNTIIMNILSIGGSDPSTGAGIQSDVKTFSTNGIYPFTVITAITSQNTKKISSIEPVSRRSLELQIDSVLSDFHIDAVKIGMVFNSQIIKVLHSKLKDSNFHAMQVPYMDMGVACSPFEVEAPELDPTYPLWVGNLEQLIYQK